MDVIDRLRRLARDANVTSSAELRRFAKARDIKHTAELQEALKTNVAAQVLAPKAKFVSQSAAEQAGSRIQADLAKFPATSRNTRSHWWPPMSTRARPTQNRSKTRPPK